MYPFSPSSPSHKNGNVNKMMIPVTFYSSFHDLSFVETLPSLQRSHSITQGNQPSPQFLAAPLKKKIERMFKSKMGFDYLNSKAENLYWYTLCCLLKTKSSNLWQLDSKSHQKSKLRLFKRFLLCHKVVVCNCFHFWTDIISCLLTGLLTTGLDFV